LAKLFDHLVGNREYVLRNGKTERWAVFRLMTGSNLVGCSTSSYFHDLILLPLDNMQR
jgi:hypothetical protein